MGLFIFADPASAGGFGKTCSKIITSLLKSDRTEPTAAPSGPRDVILRRFDTVSDLFDFEWSPQGDSVLITFAENRQKMNQTLLNVASLLALTFDGREFVYRDSFVPVKTNEAEPQFVLTVDRHLDPTPSEIARLSSPKYFGQGPRAKELTPRSSITAHDYVGFGALLLRADRMAFSEIAVQVTSLRIDADAATLARMRGQLRLLLPGRLARRLTAPGITSRSGGTGIQWGRSTREPGGTT